MAALGWMQPIDIIASRATLIMSQTEGERERPLSGAELARADEHDLLVHALLGEQPVDRVKPIRTQRDVIGEHEGPRRCRLAAVDRDGSRAALGALDLAATSRQTRGLPTADLMPTGRPVASAIRSMKSSMLDTSRGVWFAGEMQSRRAGCRGLRDWGGP